MSQIGRITTVHTDTERKEVYVDVRTGPSKFYPGLPFTMPVSSMWHVPEEGELVEVYNIDSGTRAVRYPHRTPTFSMPDLGEGDFCFKLNEGTKLEFSKQSDGSYNVLLEADGEVTVSAPTVNLGGENATQVVARKGDTVEVQSSLEGTLTGEITSGASNTKAE